MDTNIIVFLMMEKGIDLVLDMAAIVMSVTMGVPVGIVPVGNIKRVQGQPVQYLLLSS